MNHTSRITFSQLLLNVTRKRIVSLFTNQILLKLETIPSLPSCTSWCNSICNHKERRKKSMELSLRICSQLTPESRATQCYTQSSGALSTWSGHPTNTKKIQNNSLTKEIISIPSSKWKLKCNNNQIIIIVWIIMYQTTQIKSTGTSLESAQGIARKVRSSRIHT